MDLAVTVSGSGLPLLALHGHPGSGQCLSVLTQPLSQRLLTIAPDLRGYGRSTAHAPFQMRDHLDDLAAVLEQHHIQHCLVLGWSLGGILALELALRFPQRVKGLILIATAARPRSSHPLISWQDNFFTGLAGGLNWLVPGWYWNIESLGRRSLFRYLVQQHTPQTYRYLARDAVPAFLQTSRYAQQALAHALQSGYNRLPDLHRIQCPCLVMAGACDRHITPESSRETADHLPHSEWICYPQTAHLFPWEIPEQVCGDIEDWLERHGQQFTSPEA